MILKRPLAVLLIFIKTLDGSVPSLSELNDDMTNLTLNEVSQEGQLNDSDFPKSLMQSEEAPKQEEINRPDFLTESGRVKSFVLNQADGEKSPHLHLEDFPFPKQLPEFVHRFDLLMNHGYECFPVPHFIAKMCSEGRLDLLKYLYELNSKLIPTKMDLELAAENGWVEIIVWAHQLKIYNWNLNNRVAILAINRHFKALEWLMEEIKVIFDGKMIQEIISAGVLVALEWIDERQPMEKGEQEWADIAAKNRHLPILQWLYKKFGLVPNVDSLQMATVEILEWIKEIDQSLIDSKLVICVADNFPLLQWIYKTFPSSFCNATKNALSAGVNSKEMMIWLYTTLKIRPFSLDWAYVTGDLGAIEWAKKKFRSNPTKINLRLATENGHLSVINWSTTNYPARMRRPGLLKIAIENGHLDIANVLLPIVVHPSKPLVLSLSKVFEKGQLRVASWIHSHGYTFLPSDTEIAISKGHLTVLQWLCIIHPSEYPLPSTWSISAAQGQDKIYKWLLDRYPEKNGFDGICDNIRSAFTGGHLEVVKLILAKYPLLAKEISGLEITRMNHHISKWLSLNGFDTQ